MLIEISAKEIRLDSNMTSNRIGKGPTEMKNSFLYNYKPISSIFINNNQYNIVKRTWISNDIYIKGGM